MREDLATRLGAELGDLVRPMFRQLEAELTAKIMAGLPKEALIDRQGALVLTFGDGSARNLGPVVGRDGRDGVEVLGQPEQLTEALAKRLEALEGQSVTKALLDHSGQLVLILASGESLSVGQVVGRDGRDGADGAPGERGAAGQDGLGFDDLDLVVGEDGRTLAIRFTRGEAVKAFDLAFPVLVYRGVFHADREDDYQPGDAVTFGGSVWVCGQPTRMRPGEGEGAWTLAVKRGRDGKDFAGPQPRAPK